MCFYVFMFLCFYVFVSEGGVSSMYNERQGDERGRKRETGELEKDERNYKETEEN